jgi:hypothetical protein
VRHARVWQNKTNNKNGKTRYLRSRIDEELPMVSYLQAFLVDQGNQQLQVDAAQAMCHSA